MGKKPIRKPPTRTDSGQVSRPNTPPVYPDPPDPSPVIRAITNAEMLLPPIHQKIQNSIGPGVSRLAVIHQNIANHVQFPINTLLGSVIQTHTRIGAKVANNLESSLSVPFGILTQVSKKVFPVAKQGVGGTYLGVGPPLESPIVAGPQQSPSPAPITVNPPVSGPSSPTGPSFPASPVSGSPPGTTRGPFQECGGPIGSPVSPGIGGPAGTPEDPIIVASICDAYPYLNWESPIALDLGSGNFPIGDICTNAVQWQYYDGPSVQPGWKVVQVKDTLVKVQASVACAAQPSTGGSSPPGNQSCISICGWPPPPTPIQTPSPTKVTRPSPAMVEEHGPKPKVAPRLNADGYIWYPCTDFNPSNLLGGESAGNEVLHLLKGLLPTIDGSSGNAIVDAVWQGILGLANPVIDAVISTYSHWLSGAVKEPAYNDPQVVAVQVSKFLLDLLQKLTAIDYSQISNRYTALLNTAVRSTLPGPGDAVQSFLSNVIDIDQYHCLTAAAGLWDGHADNAIKAQQTRLDAGSVLRSTWRGLLSEEEAFVKYRELGYIDTNIIELYKQISKPIPGVGDLISYMARDVADENLVEKFGLDADFESKWTGRLAEWGKWQGLDETIPRFAWRAHWQIPSPAFLLEYFQRFRNTGIFGPQESLQADLEEVLKQQDILPYWIPKYIASAYKPILRIDGRLMFQAGLIDDDKMILSFNAQGYDDENSQLLLREAKHRRLQLVKQHPAVKAAAAGEITPDDAYKVVGAVGLARSVFDQAYEDERLLVTGRLRKTAIDAARGGYVTGRLTETDLAQYYDEAQLDPILAEAEISAARAERRSREKLATLPELLTKLRYEQITEDEFIQVLKDQNYSQNAIDAIVLTEYKLPVKGDILKWVSLGAMSPALAIRKLVEIGESPEDASMIVDAHLYEDHLKYLKAAAAEQAKAERAAEQAQKQAAAAAAKAAAAAAKAAATKAKEAKAEAAAAAKTAKQKEAAAAALLRLAQQKAKRDTQYLSNLNTIALKLAKSEGEPPANAVQEVTSLYDSLIGVGTYTEGQIVAILKLGAAAYTSKIAMSFPDWINNLISNGSSFMGIMTELEAAYESGQ